MRFHKPFTNFVLFSLTINICSVRFSWDLSCIQFLRLFLLQNIKMKIISTQWPPEQRLIFNIYDRIKSVKCVTTWQANRISELMPCYLNRLIHQINIILTKRKEKLISCWISCVELDPEPNTNIKSELLPFTQKTFSFPSFFLCCDCINSNNPDRNSVSK